MLSKVRDIIQAHGVSGLASKTIAYAYREGVRPFLPTREPVRYAGIRICHDVKWGDRIVPKSWVPGDALAGNQPNYEGTLVAGLKETIKSGDRVVIVGGGVGVTATVAALRTGPSGTVECFEGGKQQVRFVRQTAARNGVDNVSVHHAIVANAIAVFGSDLGTILPPSQLPACNVLQLDCEGAEAEILRELTIQPRVILVETHGVYGAPTDLVASLLLKRSYTVSHRGEAVPGDDLCKKKRHPGASRKQLRFAAMIAGFSA
jgi:hypothetical protein